MTTTSAVSPREWTAPPSDVLLADGTIAVIRWLRVDDRDAVLALHENVSQDTLRLRFFTANPMAGRQYVAQLFDPAHRSAFALLGVVRGRVAGLATASCLAPDRAEVAFLVSDQDRGRGLGSLLLEHLAALGREHGLTRFDADVLADNYGMLRVFRGAGFAVSRHGGRRGLRRAPHRRLGRGARRRRPPRVALGGPLAAAAARTRERRRGRRTPLGRRSRPRGARRDHRGRVRRPAVRRAPAAEAEGTDRRTAGVPQRGRDPGAGRPRGRRGARRRGARRDGRRVRGRCRRGGHRLVGCHRRPASRRHRALVALARAHSVRLVGPNSQGVLSLGALSTLNTSFARALPTPAGSRWPRSRAASASRCSTSPATWASACTPSSPWAPSSTCRATTCWRPGATTTR